MRKIINVMLDKFCGYCKKQPCGCPGVVAAASTEVCYDPMSVMSQSMQSIIEEKFSIALEALELIAAPKRRDGTYNRSREACEKLARVALDRIYGASGEAITHAAVMAIDGRAFTGKSHSDCFRKIDDSGAEARREADAQGFLTSTGRFVDRKEAATIAISAGQIENQNCEILFSEDLWSKQSGGKYKYDEDRGYYL